ncbi:4Fe-4S binding protein [Clostridium tetani]|uniref:4Fe-4S binding protein n=1 Tax=Clostridium tetani TaxID=1513 RepID=UPI0009B8A079|nr:4Fe-4S binding protein [Clostridium tetani]RXM71383.1 4Fe-4S binding protein [Clostridium tetani]
MQKPLDCVWSVLELDRKRNIIQAFSTFITNIHFPNFLKGVLYNGQIKRVCVPGLNCYSCPAATGACPIGSFQAVVGSSKFSFSYYITGILILFGVLLGRFICGFFCPFGWFQDLLYKIPFKKFSTKKLKLLTYLKYLMLFVVVGLLPILITNNVGMGSPFFCKYVCPQGILEGGIPLSIANKGIRSSLGALFALKSVILVMVILLSIMFYRPFCKWICPLGAFYSFFNKISLYSYDFNKDKCVNCGKCRRVCKMDVDITKSTTHNECIRCGECIKVCPTKAISTFWGYEKRNSSTKIIGKYKNI